MRPSSTVRLTRRPAPEPDPVRVVVVGAGIAGLAAATAARRARPDVEVLVLEAAPEAGGKLRLAEVAGIRVDVGAEAMLNRRPEAVELAVAAGLEDRLVHPADHVGQHLVPRPDAHDAPRRCSASRSTARSSPTPGSSLRRASRGPPWTACCRRPGSTTVTSAWAGSSRSGSAARSSTGSSSRCSAGCTPATPGRSPPAPLRPQVVALLDRERSMMKAAAAAVAGSPADRTTPSSPGWRVGWAGWPRPWPRRLDVRTGATVRDLVRSADGRLARGGRPASDPRAHRARTRVVVADPRLPERPAARRRRAGRGRWSWRASSTPRWPS